MTQTTTAPLTTVTKGQTIFNTETGAPSVVRSTRRLPATSYRGERLRVEFVGGVTVDLPTTKYAAAQTAQMAETHAAFLRAKETREAESRKKYDTMLRARAKHRDLLNAPVEYSRLTLVPLTKERREGRVEFVSTEPRFNGETLKVYEREHDYAITYRQSTREVVMADGNEGTVPAMVLGVSGWGTVTPAFAKRYAEAILLAVAEAEKVQAQLSTTITPE